MRILGLFRAQYRGCDHGHDHDVRDGRLCSSFCFLFLTVLKLSNTKIETEVLN